MREIKINGIYKHFKGDYYLVLDVAGHSETKELYVVYRSFGLNEQSLLTMILLQAAISVSVDMLPLPGGMGISERLFLQIFAPLFGSTALTLSGMLLSRGISYYMLVILSGIITIITHLTVKPAPNDNES